MHRPIAKLWIDRCTTPMVCVFGQCAAGDRVEVLPTT